MLHSTGPLLSIDVGERTTVETDITEVQERYIGGRGVATRLAHERVPFDADPLGPENRAVFTTGPMQASQMSFTGRTNCTALSPLTDGLLSSNAGGFVSRHLAATGYGAIELAGASDELVVLHVRDDGVEFEAVPGLAGATVSETTDYLDDEHDIPSDRTAVIGPAGENEVRFASIMTTEERAFGRGGQVGRGPRIEERQGRHVRRRFGARPRDQRDRQRDPPRGRHRGPHHERAGDGGGDGPRKRDGRVAVVLLLRALLRGRRGDQRRGRRGEEVQEGNLLQRARSPASSRPATRRAASRPKAPSSRWRWRSARTRGVDDIVDVMESNRLCDEYGLDAISAGNTIAAYLAAEDEFGNRELIWDLVDKIAQRDGVGDQLAEGSVGFTTTSAWGTGR